MTKEQWQAILSRDPAYDGQFFYASKTSKAVCRPSCTAYPRTLKNAVLFTSLEEALQEGYHPCGRCHPELSEWRGAKQELAERAISYIQAHFTEKFSLTELAKALFVDKIYLSKSFKEATGSTLLSFHNQTRCQFACQLLTDPATSIELVASQCGFSTPSHFSRVFKSIYRCTPSDYRQNYLNDL